MTSDQDIWIFGYGSLMWSPGFKVAEDVPARLPGYHRDLCILSYVFRGTPEVPGIVVGLNPGGACAGRAFRVCAEHVPETMDYLHEREMVNNVYTPTWVDITLGDARNVSAYTFVAVRDHAQYVGHLDQEEKVAYVLQGYGAGGSALEYLENTCTHLRSLGINDETLEAILQAAQAKSGK
ncbi:MAG: gamma-glutamylcyclotransferase [Methylocystaceae bacterium]|nr:gamma-glutamylcyclotransferase [Methylocystaceae bacterium]